ncbi:MAG: hypothetical protein V1833_04215 [Elusimicrobiota bacterium]
MKMFNFKRMRRDYYVDPKLQFKYISASLLATFINLGIFVLWMVSISIISGFVVDGIGLQLIKYGGTVLVILIIILLSTNMGISISHHIAGPIYKFSQKTKEIKKGVIASGIFLRENDEFVSFQADFNDMMEGLEIIVKKDRTKIKEINRKLDNLCENVSKFTKEEFRSSVVEIKQEIQNLTQSFVLNENVEREYTRM